MNWRDRNRLNRGLRWYDHRAPLPTTTEVFRAVLIALLLTLAYIFTSWQDAQAGLLDAQAKRIQTEVALVALLNEGVVVDRDSGMAIAASIHTVEAHEVLVVRATP